MLTDICLITLLVVFSFFGLLVIKMWTKLMELLLIINKT